MKPRTRQPGFNIYSFMVTVEPLAVGGVGARGNASHVGVCAGGMRMVQATNNKTLYSVHTG